MQRSGESVWAVANLDRDVVRTLREVNLMGQAGGGLEVAVFFVDFFGLAAELSDLLHFEQTFFD